MSYIPQNVFEKDKKDFDALIESISSNGFLDNHPITIDLDGNLIDGTHRIACCVFFGIDNIKARIVKRHLSPVPLSKKIELLCLSKNEMDMLLTIYDEMFLRMEANSNGR